ncbi:unnamed protein product [Protopolystoma xenopodis]|uniref:Secreted protein n=1 Tax=Protopolystoma xenopodis TaxID=117903 RepID=A0A448WTU5_9PLAT|nr:unnamed protein product [Protopolystoma xenopodis]
MAWTCLTYLGLLPFRFCHISPLAEFFFCHPQVNTSELEYHISKLVALSVAEVLGINLFPCPIRFV